MGVPARATVGADGRKRRVYLGLLGLSTLGALMALLVNLARGAPSPLITAAALVVVAGNATLAGLTVARRVRLPVLEWVLLFSFTAVIVANLVHALYLAPLDAGAVDGGRAAMHWLPVAFVVAYIALDARRAARVSLGILLGVVLVAAPAFLAGPEAAAVVGSAAEFAQVVLAYAVTLVALSFFAGLPQRLVRWRETAHEMRALAFSDALTGLANRRWAEAQLDLELARAERYGGGFAVIVIDIDRFKRLNDAHGHAVGDEVLSGIAATLRRSLRASDRVARWGGEEFLVLVPETPLPAAVELAGVLRRQVATTPLGNDGHVVTISLGVAGWAKGDTRGTLVERADAALYVAKGEGRDRVAVAAPDGAASDARGRAVVG
ncbi:MAG: GGDEF domain-containing protein [Trueperaceae bacterium]